jgi:hypothetical protein
MSHRFSRSKHERKLLHLGGPVSAKVNRRPDGRGAPTRETHNAAPAEYLGRAVSRRRPITGNDLRDANEEIPKTTPDSRFSVAAFRLPFNEPVRPVGVVPIWRGVSQWTRNDRIYSQGHWSSTDRLR